MYFRITLAEQEARTEFLKKKARDRQIERISSHKEVPSTSQNALVAADLPSGHINLFQCEEEGKKYGKNEEYEAERKAEKEKYEKDIGILTYLGQSAVEAQQSKPWYYKSPDRKRKHDDYEGMPKSRETIREEYDQKRKSDLDPMRQMTKYLDIKDKHKRKHRDSISKKDEKRKHKYHKRDIDCREREAGRSGKKTIEQLRAERLKREKEERRKAEEVLAKARGEQVPVKEKEVVLDERERTYNSQFNPDFVRKPRHVSSYYH